MWACMCAFHTHGIILILDYILTSTQLSTHTRMTTALTFSMKTAGEGTQGYMACHRRVPCLPGCWQLRMGHESHTRDSRPHSPTSEGLPGLPPELHWAQLMVDLAWPSEKNPHLKHRQGRVCQCPGKAQCFQVCLMQVLYSGQCSGKPTASRPALTPRRQDRAGWGGARLRTQEQDTGECDGLPAPLPGTSPLPGAHCLLGAQRSSPSSVASTVRLCQMRASRSRDTAVLMVPSSGSMEKQYSGSEWGRMEYLGKMGLG